MYRVWVSGETDERTAPRFRSLEDAHRFIRSYAGSGSLALQGPDGSFLTLADDRITVRNVRAEPRHDVDVSVVLDLQPGRDSRGAGLVQCRVLDVSPRGLRVRRPTRHITIWVGAPVWVRLDDSAEYGVASRVKRVTPDELGLEVVPTQPHMTKRFTDWVNAVTEQTPPLAVGSDVYPTR